MNKKHKLVAKKHRRNKERIKALKQGSILAGVKKAEKSVPKTESKAAAKKITTKIKCKATKPVAKKPFAKTPVAKKPVAKKATAVKKKPKITKKSTTKIKKAES